MIGSGKSMSLKRQRSGGRANGKKLTVALKRKSAGTCLTCEAGATQLLCGRPWRCLIGSQCQHVPGACVSAMHLRLRPADCHVRLPLAFHASATPRTTPHPCTGQPSLPDDFEEASWTKLSELVSAVQTSSPIAHSRQELYQAVEDMCKHKMAGSLYTRLQLKCQSHVAKVVHLLSAVQGTGAPLLQAVAEAWKQHKQQMLLIRQVFMYLDRTYMAASTPHSTLWAMGLHQFGEVWRQEEGVRRRTTRAVLDALMASRTGEAVDLATLAVVVRMQQAVGLFSLDVQPELLEEAAAYYKGEGGSRCASLSLPAYCKYVAGSLRHEAEVGGRVLPTSTCEALAALIDKHCLEAHKDTMLATGFVDLMTTVLNKRPGAGEDLALLHSLFSRLGSDALLDLRRSFQSVMTETAKALVEKDGNEKELVSSLLALKEDCNVIVVDSFRGSSAFAGAVKAAFETAVNSRSRSFPKLLAKFVDGKLRVGNKTESEEQVERLLEKVMVLFRACSSKDVFQAFYRKDLAKRLLLDRSASSSLERGFLELLKMDCGPVFTAKMEGMFSDMDTSAQLLEVYKATAECSACEAATGIKSEVRVLTGGHWPAYPVLPSLILTPELKQCTEAFEAFYKGKVGDKRKLVWQHALTHAVLRAVFPSGRKELSVSLYQALVLLQWNDEEVQRVGAGEGAGPDGITFRELQARTGLTEEEAKRAMMSMVIGKVRVLTKAPAVKSVKPTDVISYNAEFKSKMARLKINQLQLRETKKEVAETEEWVVKERQFKVDAAIVRIMKSRQTLSHSQLVSSVVQALPFEVQPTDIKKRIQSLIGRDYLERDEDDPMVYIYLA